MRYTMTFFAAFALALAGTRRVAPAGEVAIEFADSSIMVSITDTVLI